MYKYPMGRAEYNRQQDRLKLMYAITTALAIVMALVIAWSVQQHRRDVAEIRQLTSANEKLKAENTGLHNINIEIGKERDEAVKWLESIQPGINFDGI